MKHNKIIQAGWVKVGQPRVSKSCVKPKDNKIISISFNEMSVFEVGVSNKNIHKVSIKK